MESYFRPTTYVPMCPIDVSEMKRLRYIQFNRIVDCIPSRVKRDTHTHTQQQPTRKKNGGRLRYVQRTLSSDMICCGRFGSGRCLFPTIKFVFLIAKEANLNDVFSVNFFFLVVKLRVATLILPHSTAYERIQSIHIHFSLM